LVVRERWQKRKNKEKKKETDSAIIGKISRRKKAEERP